MMKTIDSPQKYKMKTMDFNIPSTIAIVAKKEHLTNYNFFGCLRFQTNSFWLSLIEVIFFSRLLNDDLKFINNALNTYFYTLLVYSSPTLFLLLLSLPLLSPPLWIARLEPPPIFWWPWLWTSHHSLTDDTTINWFFFKKICWGV